MSQHGSDGHFSKSPSSTTEKLEARPVSSNASKASAAQSVKSSSNKSARATELCPSCLQRYNVVWNGKWYIFVDHRDVHNVTNRCQFAGKASPRKCATNDGNTLPKSSSKGKAQAIRKTSVSSAGTAHTSCTVPPNVIQSGTANNALDPAASWVVRGGKHVRRYRFNRFAMSDEAYDFPVPPMDIRPSDFVQLRFEPAENLFIGFKPSKVMTYSVNYDLYAFACKKAFLVPRTTQFARALMAMTVAWCRENGIKSEAIAYTLSTPVVSAVMYRTPAEVLFAQTVTHDSTEQHYDDVNNMAKGTIVRDPVLINKIKHAAKVAAIATATIGSLYLINRIKTGLALTGKTCAAVNAFVNLGSLATSFAASYHILRTFLPGGYDGSMDNKTIATK